MGFFDRFKKNWKDDENYSMKDFGEFKTLMKKGYSDISFNEYIPSINIPDCKVKIFEHESHHYEVPRKSTIRLNSYLDFYSTKYKEVSETRTKYSVFKITYFEFLTEKDHKSKEKEIRKMVKELFHKNTLDCSYSYYCNGNIHINFESYNVEYSPYAERNLYSSCNIDCQNVRIASRYVEL